MRFTRQPQREGGWVLCYDYLNHVQSLMNDKEIGIVDLETIEAVLLAAEEVEAQTQQATQAVRQPEEPASAHA